MAAISDYLENALLNHVFGGATYTQPSVRYLALFTTATTDAGGGTEAVGGSYARQAITFGAASAGTVSNTGTLTYNNMQAGTYTHCAVMDAATGGNMLYHGPLGAARTAFAGDTITVGAAAITCSLD